MIHGISPIFNGISPAIYIPLFNGQDSGTMERYIQWDILEKIHAWYLYIYIYVCICVWYMYGVYIYIHMMAISMAMTQEPKLEVPTIYKAYFLGLLFRPM